jgi:glycolate oxidase FAD binding subunit
VSGAVATDAVAAFAHEVGHRGPIAVEGGRTRWDLGGPLDDGTRLVRAPSGVLERVPEEMIVRVLAGTTVAELDDALADAGQRSALPSRAGTVGGALAVGENHLDVLARGPVRASLLQVRYVAHDGRVITGGAPTVKNVSGFDIPRLVVGSLGTLGLLAEVVLRTNPTPAASVWLASGDTDPFAAALVLHRRATVLWDGATTWVHLEGHGVDVDDRRRALPGRWEQVDGPPPLPAHRWSLAPSALRGLPERSDRPGSFVASLAVGTVWADGPQPPRHLDPGARQVADRAKQLFDPTGRLNPGRDPSRR